MIITDFLSTVSYKQALHSLYFVTFGLIKLRFGKENKKLISELQNYYGKEYSISTYYNARTALYQYLISLDFKKNTEIIVSGYNCVSVTNATMQAGMNPVYCDIEIDTFGIDYKKLITLVSPKTKVIILQHTFGSAARDTKKIINFAKKQGILVIEDVAHALGATLASQKLGTFGDAAIFSTRRDKVISSVNGAWLLEKGESKVYKSTLKIPSIGLTIKNHLYNILGLVAKKTYSFLKLGSVIMLLARKLQLFPEIVSKQELHSNSKKLHYSLPNSLASLLRTEFLHFEKYNEIRKIYNASYQKQLKSREIFQNFIEGNAFRCVLICKNSEEQKSLVTTMKAKGIILGTSWVNKNIAPIGTNLKLAKYIPGSCPNAENIASRVVFLPNSYVHKSREIQIIIEELNNYNN